jgi:hypothetical protein
MAMTETTRDLTAARAARRRCRAFLSRAQVLGPDALARGPGGGQVAGGLGHRHAPS